MTTAHAKDAADPSFVASLHAGHYYESRTAAWIYATGKYWVTQKPLQVRRNDQDYRECSDSGDLLVRLIPNTEGGDDEVVEVKWRPRLNFTCAADYPYPDSICVCDAHRFDPTDMPLAFFIWNAAGTHFAIIYPDTTAKHWIRKPFYQNGVRKPDLFMCPLNLVSNWKRDGTPIDTRKDWNCAEDWQTH
mgnify:CR=1 FL=1